jgi:biotin carboxylase
MIAQTPDYDAKIAQVQKRLRANEEAFEAEKRGYDSYKIVNLKQLIDHDRHLLRDLNQKRGACQPAGADNQRGSSAIFYGSNS